MVKREQVRLWIPKKINGKWYWLRKVWKYTDIIEMVVEGNVVNYKSVTYKLY